MGNVRIDIVKSVIVDNMGIAVGFAAPFFAVQKLFPLPVLLAAILNFGSLSSSTNVGQRRPASGSVMRVKSKSGVVDNVEEAIGIASQSTTVEKLFPVPVW